MRQEDDLQAFCSGPAVVYSGRRRNTVYVNDKPWIEEVFFFNRISPLSVDICNFMPNLLSRAVPN
jgi:hypothetical protein